MIETPIPHLNGLQPDQITLSVISLWQPWATWVALGWKTIETRTHDRFKNLAGKRIGIHAAKKWDNNALSFASDYLTTRQVDRTLTWANKPDYGLVATAYVEKHILAIPRDAECALVECCTYRFGLFLSGIRQINPPINIPGRQGIFTVRFPGNAASARKTE